MAEKSISIRSMPVGAEVIGLASGCEEDPGVRALLYDAWLKHGILLFRDIDSIERHLALSQCFGELEIHPFAPVRSDLHPLLIEIGGKKRPPAYVFDDADIRCNRIAWHRDTAYTPDICKGAMLRMVQVPRQHGETMFADMAMAYDDLPADVKARLEGLEYKATLSLTPIDQTVGSAIYLEFYRKATGRDLAQVKAIWSRILFTGRGLPPKQLPDSAAVKQAVAADPKAVGYIEKSAVDASVKVAVPID